MEFRVLGPLEVRVDGLPLPVGGTKPRAVLAQLLLHRGEVVSRDRLVDGLWLTPPETAAKALQVHVSQLRKALAPHAVIRSSARGYVLDVGPDAVDVERFERLCADAAVAEPAAASHLLAEALHLWRGEPLAEFADEPFARVEAGRLAELRLRALEAHADAELALGRHADVVAELEALVAAEPLREGLRARLVLALYRSGRQADALESLRSARRLLVEDLGIDPGPELQRLERAILVQDPSLDPPLMPTAAPRSPEPAPVPAAAPLEVRKTVTVVFCDVSGSTAHGDERDPEVMRRVMTRYYDEMRAALERHGGTVEKFIGDAVMAVFGTPVLHEDDALRALRAAVEMRERLEELNRELEATVGIRLEARIGVNSGQVVAGDPGRRDAFVTGDAVNVAQRLEARAAPGEILVGPVTYALAHHEVQAEPVGSLELKGKRDGVAAYRLVAIRGAADAVPRLRSPLVGRGRELLLLQEAFGRAVQGRACHLFTVFGAAGVGKSRLVAEALDALGARALVLRGACPPYGEGITFHALRDVVEALEVPGDLLDSPSETLFAALRRALEDAARVQPLVVAFDDVNWGEPTFLDLIEHLADRIRDAPVLLVCTARIELLDRRPGWGGGKLNATSIVLDALSNAETQRLIRNLLGRDDVESGLARTIARTAEGNPLFVEEMVGLLLDEKLIRREDRRWRSVGESGVVPVPPSIQVLLAARLDLLASDERRTLERAAVAGQRFRVAAVAALDDAAPTAADVRLEALARRDLVREAGDGVYAFRHVLIRDAAYDALPKSVRAELHERLARWLDEEDEEDEVVGYHLEQAVRYRRELGLSGEETAALGTRAGARLGAAGERAAAHDDVPAAVTLLERAVAVLPDGAPSRGRLLGTLGGTLMRGGEFGRAGEVLDAAAIAARDAGDRPTEVRATVDRQLCRSFTSGHGAAEADARVAAEAIAELEPLGDHFGLAKAWRLLSDVHVYACHWEARAEALERALAHARLVPEARQESRALAGLLAQALQYGPTPVPEALVRCRDLLAGAGDDRALRAGILTSVAGLHAMLGDFDAARALVAEANAVYDELGLRLRRAARALVPAQIEALAGDFAAAEAELREACATLEAMGERGVRATLSAFLADVLVAAGRLDEAERWALQVADLAGDDDVIPQVLRRAVAARVGAARGDAGAERLAREAVERAAATDFLDLHARALEALADVLGADARDAEARSAVADALALHERKGNLVAAARLARRAAGVIV